MAGDPTCEQCNRSVWDNENAVYAAGGWFCNAVCLGQWISQFLGEIDP